MLQAKSPWRRRRAPDDVVAELEHELGVSHLSARLLALRGVGDPDHGRRFVGKRLADLHRPELLRDMKVAARRLAKAIDQRERILVHGDFDVDGSTATALVKLFCRACSHDAVAWIPHRIDDGYGLSAASMEAVREHRAQVMVTVDCGICDNGWAARIERECGCDVIVTDHHLPQHALPQCLAACNPNRPDCGYPDKGLAGVGLAWKLCWATACELCGSEKISDRLRAFLLDGLALVAVGTVADCAPLDGENRILVHHGLQALARTRNPGLQALLAHCRLNAPISADDIGWRIGPLLNASGRLSSAMRNIALLMAADEAEAQAVVREVVEENDERRRLSHLLTEDLIAEVESNPDHVARGGLVFAGDGWHPGIVGIVASRLAERFAKPTCIIAIENGLGRGSLRSVPGLDLSRAIEACRPLLRSGGGHAAAAGLSIRQDDVPAFCEAFDGWVREQHPGGLPPPSIEHDGSATIAELDQAFYDDLQGLEPFGTHNPEPVLQLEQVQFVTRPELFGKGGDHLRGALTDAGGGLQPFFAWRGKDYLQAFSTPGCRFDILVRPQLSHWRGDARPRLVFVDGCVCGAEPLPR